MELSEFIDAYQAAGNNILLEAQEVTPENVNRWTSIFANLSGLDPPEDQRGGDPGMAQEKSIANPGTPYSSESRNKGVVTMQIKFKPPTEKGAGLGAAGSLPRNGTFTFIYSDWKLIVDAYKKNPEEAELSRKAAEDEKGTAQETISAAKLKKQVEEEAQKVADDAGQRAADALASVGFESDNDAMRTMMRQLCGGGRSGALRRAARARSDEALDVTYLPEKELKDTQSTLTQEEGVQKAQENAAECAEDVKHLEKTVLNLVAIKRKLDLGEKLSEADRKFLRDCFRLRGQRDSQKKGIYMVPDPVNGQYCGGPLAAAAVEYQEGGHNYGVQINNQDGPLYKMMVQIHDDSLKKKDPLYGENGFDTSGKPKPAIFWGGTNAAKANAYRGMAGVMAEHGPKIAKAWMECGHKQDPSRGCPGLQEAIKNMMAEENFDLNLLIWGAEERNAGRIPDYQFATINEIGTDLILDQIEKELGEEVDGSKALAWFTATMINSWNPLVSDPQFKGCDFNVVGRGPTGQVKAGKNIGAKITQDVEVTCPEEEGKTHLEAFEQHGKFNVNSGEGSFGTDDDKNRDHYDRPDATGVNLKFSFGGELIQMGKISCAVVDGVETDPPKTGKIVGFSPDTRAARNRALNYIETVAKNLGQKFDKKDAEAADNYKLGEIQFSHDTMAAIEGLNGASIHSIFKGEINKLAYPDGKAFGKLQKHIEEYENAPEGSVDKEKARKRIETTLTQAYRNQHRNDPGFRTNLAIEMMQAGSASQNQLLVITEPGKDTCISTESDAINKQIMEDVLGYGNPEGTPKAKIKVTGTSTTLSTGQELTRRVKDNSKVQEVRYPSKKTKENMSCKGGGGNAPGLEVGNSAMKAEDFVRQLQELIKRIDKVDTV